MLYEPTTYRGQPVSTQNRDKFLLDSNIGYAKSAYQLSQTYLSGPTSEKPYNTRLTDRVEVEPINKQLSTMQRKTYTPAKAVRSREPTAKDALYDIRNVPLNEQTYLGNYLPETLKDRNRVKIYSSNAWAKNLDMMREPGQSMSDVYNSQLLTTTTNIPKSLQMSVDERLRASEQIYERPFKDENNRIQDAVRLRNNPDKIERERRQRESDVHMKNESIMQLGRYDQTAMRFTGMDLPEYRTETIIDEPIREEFGHQSERNRAENKQQKQVRFVGNNTESFLGDDEVSEMKFNPKPYYYDDSPGVKKKMYNRGDFVQLVKQGEIYDIFPDDPTSHKAPLLITPDTVTKKPIRTFATADNKNLYLIQKRDANDIYTLDGNPYRDDFVLLEIPQHDLNPVFREKINKHLGGKRRNNNELLNLEYDDLVQLSYYMDDNENRTVRLKKSHNLLNTVRDFDWNGDLENGYANDVYFMHPDLVKTNIEKRRQKIHTDRQRREDRQNDNYVYDVGETYKYNYTHDNDVHPIGFEKGRSKNKSGAVTRTEPFRGSWNFGNQFSGTKFIRT